MKKAISFLLAVAMILAVVIGLVACKGGKVTDSDLKKVQQALDGVERSMTESSSLDGVTVQAYKPVYLAGAEGITISEDALTTIFGTYTSGDRQTNADPDLEYDQPPMQQFKYLKAIFEQMGDDYELGTKYYYDITGTVYLDRETGYAVDPAESSDAASYRYDYVFGFAISIELTSDDLIFAEVAFAITLTQGTAKYQTSWYVSFDLDYDFDESKPTYTLAMYTDNKEGELPYLDRAQGYEYDYVQVSKGAIKEWRKFVLDADKEIVIDDTHSYDSYIAEGNACYTDTVKWIKDGQYYKMTQSDAAKQRILCKAFVEGIGMNSTAIGGDAFLTKSGKKSSVIDAYYKSICAIYGGDVIYDLVCKKDYSSGGSGDGSAHAWNSSVGSAVSALSSLIPGFESATASFSATVSDEGSVLITASDVSEGEYARFETALERVGFVPSGTQEGFVIFVKTTSDAVISVSVNEVSNLILVAVTANENGGNGTGGDVKSITLDDKLPVYTLGYTAYNAGQRYNGAKDLYDIIERISFGLITSAELDGLSAYDSFFFDLTLAYDASSGKTKEETAADIAKQYSGAFLGANSIWTDRENNMLHYATINGKEVLVLLASGVSEGDPHLYVYMLQFEMGNIPQILDGNAGDTGDGDEGNGEGGNEGEGNGNEGGTIGGEGAIAVEVDVYYFDRMGALQGRESIMYEMGATIEMRRLIREEWQKVYLDKSFTQEATKPVQAAKGLTLYVGLTPTGGEGGDTGEGGGSVGGDGTITTGRVMIFYLDEQGAITDYAEASYPIGIQLPLAEYEAAGNVFADKALTKQLRGSVAVTEETTLYILPKAASGSVLVNLPIIYYQANGSTDNTFITVELGAELTVADYSRGGKVYMNENCTMEAPDTITVTETLALYVRMPGEGGGEGADTSLKMTLIYCYPEGNTEEVDIPCTVNEEVEIDKYIEGDAALYWDLSGNKPLGAETITVTENITLYVLYRKGVF